MILCLFRKINHPVLYFPVSQLCHMLTSLFICLILLRVISTILAGVMILHSTSLFSHPISLHRLLCRYCVNVNVEKRQTHKRKCKCAVCAVRLIVLFLPSVLLCDTQSDHCVYARAHFSPWTRVNEGKLSSAHCRRIRR